MQSCGIRWAAPGLILRDKLQNGFAKCPAITLLKMFPLLSGQAGHFTFNDGPRLPDIVQPMVDALPSTPMSALTPAIVSKHKEALPALLFCIFVQVCF